MKTIVIFSGYVLPHLGGVEKYTDNMAKQFVKHGYKVVIVTSNYTFDENDYSKSEFIDIIRIPVYKLFVSRYPIPKKNKEYKYLIKQLDNYDDIFAIIVNTRFHLTSLIGAKYGKKRNIPVFLVEHGSQHLTVDNKILDFCGEIYEHMLTNYLKKFVDQYYGVSKEACKWQKHFNIDSNGVWYNSINDFSKGIKLNKNEKGKINILYAGRILKQKGVVELLNAFKNIENSYPNIELTIAGDGNLLPYVKENYKSKNVHFLGKINFEQLKEQYARADIFVYAPIWPEGLPTSILEAGLMNCAVIASPQGGIKEIIVDKKNGLMVSDQKELEEALVKLINDSSLRVKLAGSLVKTVKENFLWDNTAKKVINDILKSK